MSIADDSLDEALAPLERLSAQAWAAGREARARQCEMYARCRALRAGRVPWAQIARAVAHGEGRTVSGLELPREIERLKHAVMRGTGCHDFRERESDSRGDDALYRGQEADMTDRLRKRITTTTVTEEVFDGEELAPAELATGGPLADDEDDEDDDATPPLAGAEGAGPSGEPRRRGRGDCPC